MIFRFDRLVELIMHDVSFKISSDSQRTILYGQGMLKEWSGLLVLNF